jgi:hypothetical protein
MMRMLSEVSGEIADKLRTGPGGTVTIIDAGTMKDVNNRNNVTP